MSIEVASAFIGFILTLMIFSYLIGDNPLFRFAVYLFVGVASGYAATVVWHSVLVPKLFEPLGDPNTIGPIDHTFDIVHFIADKTISAYFLDR